MPDFNYRGKVYYNPVEFAMDQVGGTWKMPILWRLQDRVMRYSELRRSLKHISDKVLTTQLRELEADGFIHRKVYAEVPPKTEYSITDKGLLTIPIVAKIREFGIDLMAREGLDVSFYR